MAYLFDSPAPLAEHFRSGRALALAVTAKERMPQFPNIPTIAEAGLSEIQTPETWSGIYAPKGTSQAIVQRLNRDTNRVLKEPDLVKKLLDLGMVPASASVAEVQALVNREAPLWGPMLKSLNFVKDN